MTWPIIGYGGGGGGVWTQTGSVISADDMTASVEAAGGDAVSTYDFAVGNGSQANSGGGSSYGAAAFGSGQALGDGSVAFGGATASGLLSTAFGEASAQQLYDFAVGNTSVARGGLVYGSTAFGGGDASADGATALGLGQASGPYSLAVGQNAYAEGSSSFAVGGVAGVGSSTATGQYAVALGGGYASGTCDFAVGLNAEGDQSSASSGTFGNPGSAVAFLGGQANNGGAFAVNATAAGLDSFAVAGGETDSAGYTDIAMGFSAYANSGASYGTPGAIAMLQGNVQAVGSFAVGACSIDQPNAFKMGTDGGALFAANADGAGTAEIDAGANQVLNLGNLPTQSTVGIGGTAQPLPTSPSTYVVLSVDGTPYAFAGFPLA